MSCFVTGTDTGVGKTLVSCMLLRAYAARGLRAAGMKPVASGCLKQGEALVSEDAQALQAASSVPLTLAQINPYAFEPPVAPHLAAALVGQTIDLELIHAAYLALCARAEVVVVEGVGGFRVPLNARQDTADLVGMLGLPVVLVVGMRLGCLNHALLTAEAILARGLMLAGWVANRIDPHMALFEENLAALEERLPAPCWGVIPYRHPLTIDDVDWVLML
ncbi:MAG: dethiobiotin synthase [Methylophilaceae bacterium]|nr:dethiobiotin synthase [Methylophilaceae bacterium]